MRQAVIFALVLLTVAVLSYRLGQRHPAISRPPRVGIIAATSAPSTRPNSQVPLLPTPPVHSEVRKVFPDRTIAFTQNLKWSEAGYEAASTNLASALLQIARRPTVELKGFVTGVFSFVARHHTPAEALRYYKELPLRARRDALRALVAEWGTADSRFNEEQRYLKREEVMGMTGSSLGLEVELAYSLASSRPNAEMSKAWLETFSMHPGRSEMLAALGKSTVRDNPDALLEMTAGWSPWERERVARNALETLTRESPDKAWQWYLTRQDQFTPDFASSIFSTWASSDPGAVQTLLGTLQDPAQRLAAVESLGKVLAVRNTEEAVAWANSLPSPDEQSAAHRSIYDAAPRGIGAAIGTQDGFPTIHAIVPGSPLEGSGIQPGDRIVEVQSDNGARHMLYGKELASTISLIRGEPGSEITLRVLRPNEATGQIEEYLLPVKREQLYLNEAGSEP